MHQLQEAGVAAGVVQNAHDLLEVDLQLRHRGHYHLLNHPVTGPTLYMGPAFALSATPALLRPAPCIGQHNAYVYGQLLGMSEAKVGAQGVSQLDLVEPVIAAHQREQEAAVLGHHGNRLQRGPARSRRARAPGPPYA